MIFEQMWPLFFLAAVPVIIILYLLKPKGEDLRVSSNLLWRKLLKNEQAQTIFEKFTHNLLMYLQILIIALLVTALMAPFFWREKQGGGREILLIDTSGSMQHAGGDGKTRLEEAVEQARAHVKAAEGVRFSVVTVDGGGARLLAVDIGESDRVIKPLQGIAASDSGGELTLAQGILDTLAGGGQEAQAAPKLTVYTDGAGAAEFEALRCAGSRTLAVVGEACANVSSEYTVYAQREDGFWDVMTSAANYSGATASFDVGLYDGEEHLLDLRQMQLKPAESAVCLFEKVDWQGDILTARLSGIAFSDGSADSLKGDNVSHAVKERGGRIRGLLVGDGNTFLEKAYQAVTGESIVKAESDLAVEQDIGDGVYNAVIYDAGASPAVSDCNRLIFGNAYGEASEELHNVLLTVKNSGLTESFYRRGNAEFTVGVNAAYCFAPPEGAVSFLEYDGKCAGYYRETAGGKEIVVGFDIRESDFPLQAEFPIFLANALNYLSDTSWLASGVFYAGENIVLQPWAETDRSLFESCPEKAGIYQVGNEEYQEYYVVRFQTATESDGRQEAASVYGGGGEARLQAKQTLRKVFLAIAILLLAAEWVVYVRQMRYRGVFYAVIRGLVLLCAVLSLFDIRLRLRSKEAATVFLVDCSDSNRENQQKMAEYLRRTVAGMPSGNVYGIVTFGRDAQVEQFLTSEKRMGEIMTVPDRASTNFEQAISGALSLIPGDRAGRLVLLTDGKETRGDMQNMARAVTEGEIEFLTLLYEDEAKQDAYIENVEMPAYLHPGDEYSVTVLVESNYDTDARLLIYGGSSLRGSREVHLNAGRNRFVLRQQVGGAEAGGSMENLRVQVQAAGDTCLENDSFSAYSVVEAMPRTLVISGMGTDVSALSSVLNAAGADISMVSALNAPADINAMLEYKCIVLANVFIGDLPQGFLDNIETYVKDYGCGFVCCGGEDSYALGGYRDTALETVLPVDMMLRGVDEMPSMAMVMVIDHSGSMQSVMDGGGRSSLDVAIRSAEVAVDNLRDSDFVGVLTFDDTYSWTVELGKAEDRDAIKNAIETIQEGGGTTIKPALREAFRQISRSAASVKHVVLLTDGMGETADFRDVTDDYRAGGVTLSTVAVGDGADTNLLERLADKCGGRYYYSDLSSDIPKIFAQEVFLGGDSYIQNGEISLAVNGGHELTAGLFPGGWPLVYGYISATPKTASRAVIVSAEREDPILTVWQYGLGRTVAWNSDVTGEWTGAFSGQEDYVQLWRRIVDYAAGNADMGDDSVRVVTTGDVTKIAYNAKNYDGRTEIYAAVIAPGGDSEEIRLQAVAPGRYEAETLTEQTGLYHFNIRRTDGGEISSMLTAAAAVQFSDEYKFDVSTAACAKFTEQYGRLIGPEENIWTALSARAGETRSLAELLLGFSIVFFVADVALRRFQYVPRWTWSPARREGEARGETLEGQRRGGQETEEKQAAAGKKAERGGKKEAMILDTSQLLKKKEDRNG